MFRTSLTLCMLLMAGIAAYAQGTVDRNGVYHPTEEEIARNKRIYELLQHPTFITLRLVSSPRDLVHEGVTDTPAPYKVKDYIGFQVFITQNSSETIKLDGAMSPYHAYRVELTRDGQIIGYKREAQERVDNGPPKYGSSSALTFEPGTERLWARVDLDDWYEPLIPGRYQLIVRKQFAWEGDWVVSNPVYFEVVSRTPGSPIPPGVTIELTPEGIQPTTHGKPYQLGREIVVAFLVRNRSDQPLKINVIDREYGNRPELFKNGKLVPYLKEVEGLIKAKEENPRLVQVVNDFFLDPQTGTWPDGIDLKKWYGPLPPGSYRLVLRHRFEIDGPWSVESKPLVFEIPATKRN